MCILCFSSHPPLYAHFQQTLHTVHLKYFIYLHSTLNQPRQPQAESHAPPLCLPACPPSRWPLCLLKYAFIRHAKEEGRRQPSLACGQTAEPGSFEVCKPWQTVHSRRDLTELPLKKVSANCSANSTGQAVNTGSDNCQLLLQWPTAVNAQGKCKSLTNVVKEQIKFTKIVKKL